MEQALVALRMGDSWYLAEGTRVVASGITEEDAKRLAAAEQRVRDLETALLDARSTLEYAASAAEPIWAAVQRADAALARVAEALGVEREGRGPGPAC